RTPPPRRGRSDPRQLAACRSASRARASRRRVRAREQSRMAGTPRNSGLARRRLPCQAIDAMASKGQRLELADAAALVRRRDSVACGFVSGQPTGFLGTLATRDDLEDVVLYTGLLVEPYGFL